MGSTRPCCSRRRRRCRWCRTRPADRGRGRTRARTRQRRRSPARWCSRRSRACCHRAAGRPGRRRFAVDRRALRGREAGVRERAMAPDGVGALGAAAGLLAFAGVDRLEVVDIAVRLVEVAVAVVVVAIPDVEGREHRVDLRRGHCRRRSASPTRLRLVDQEAPDVARADDAAAVVAAVRSLVVRDRRPSR